MSRQTHRGSLASGLTALLIAMSGLAAVSTAQSAQVASSAAALAHPTKAYWLDIKGAPATVSARGTERSIAPAKFRAATLDKGSIAAFMAGAPSEAALAGRRSTMTIALPDPSGGFQRFTLAESPVMEPGLAAKHPEIKTYAGKGIDDPTASVRLDITPLGFHASVRSASGPWYIDPYYHLDDSLYASYYARDLQNQRAPLVEPLLGRAQIGLERGLYHAADKVQVRGFGFAAGAPVSISVRNGTDAAPRQVASVLATPEGTIATDIVADPYRAVGTYTVTATDGRNTTETTYQVVGDKVATNATSGAQLRTYRLALVTDPSYATYFGGSANVTAAKVTLINRVTQVYESETSIRLVLIAGNDALNLDTAAQATGANGPCGGSACFSAAQVASCTSGTLTRNRVVVGLLVGASNYDIGHIAVGVNGGGVASLGVVGGNNKAQGCTGIPTPVGDFFAVDYVAHEMGHQFAGNHTFNGTVSNCSTGNRNAGTSVEPGSGSSIMAYAGICGTDNLQPHSDPYWSQRSFDEITTYTSSAETTVNEVQMGVLTSFSTDGQQFVLRYNGQDSAPIVRGVNFTVAGIKAAVEGIAGWPAGGTVTASTVGDTAFTLTFGGALAGQNAAQLQLVNCTGGCSGYVGEIARGGPSTKNGTVTATTNSPPTVSTAAGYTIPVRTPFALTGTASDSDGDTVTYMWEQNDRGATGTTSGTGLITQPKLNGPLFRQFGVRAVVSATDTLLYSSPGENATTTNPVRVFPDMAQILINNTNAESGSCPLASATAPTVSEIDCFSEFLPTAAYVGTASVNAGPPPSLNFRLTARDGKGGVSSANTVLSLASTAGPFLVTSPNTAVTMNGGSTQTVTWAVAGTDVAPVSTSNVKITLSTDGGLTFPVVLAANAPNTGSANVVLPSTLTTAGRVKIEAVGNVFFDVSNADFTIKAAADVNGDGVSNCADLAIVKASFGKRVGDPGFDARADINGDGVVDIRDLSIVTQALVTGSRCS